MKKNSFPGVVSDVAISPDGKYLVEVGQSELKSYEWTAYIWDLNDGKVVQEFPTGIVKSVAFSPDGNTLAFGRTPESGNLLWDRVANRKITVVRSGDHVKLIAFSPDGKLLVTGSGEGNIILWEIPDIKNK